MTTSILHPGKSATISSNFDVDTTMVVAIYSNNGTLPTNVWIGLQRKSINGSWIDVENIKLGKLILTKNVSIFQIISPGTYRLIRPDVNAYGVDIGAEIDEPILSNVPSTPLYVSAFSISANKVRVTFEPPIENGGYPITQYNLESTPSGISLNEVSCPFEFTIDPSINYEFKIAAKNSNGIGTWSTYVPIITINNIQGTLIGASVLTGGNISDQYCAIWSASMK